MKFKLYKHKVTDRFRLEGVQDDIDIDIIIGMNFTHIEEINLYNLSIFSFKVPQLENQYSFIGVFNNIDKFREHIKQEYPEFCI